MISDRRVKKGSRYHPNVTSMRSVLGYPLLLTPCTDLHQNESMRRARIKTSLIWDPGDKEADVYGGGYGPFLKLGGHVGLRVLIT